MATKLDKTIKRELEHQGKLYTITIAPDGVKVTEKGKRLGQEMSWDSIINGGGSGGSGGNAGGASGGAGPMGM